MRYLLISLLLLVQLHAAKILSYNVYDRTGRVDIMFTFDTPYEGVLRQSHQNGTITIKLDKATIESPKLKNVASEYLSKLTITPIGDQTQVIAKVSPYVVMHASRTSDAYGLRLRFERSVDTPAEEPLVASEPSMTTSLPTKPEGEFTQSYYVVIAILILGIILLLWLKRRVNGGGDTLKLKPWLLNMRGEKETKQDGVKIRFQKSLDQKNRVVMMDYADESYLLLIGTSNVMLDKFHGKRSVSEGEFEAMLKNKNRELDEFLQIDQDKKEALDSYKQKASGMDHDTSR